LPVKEGGLRATFPTIHARIRRHSRRLVKKANEDGSSKPDQLKTGTSLF